MGFFVGSDTILIIKAELNSIVGTNLVIDNSFNGEANSAVKALQTKFNKEIGTNFEVNGELNKETLYQLEMYFLNKTFYKMPTSNDKRYDLYGNAGAGDSVSNIEEKIAEMIAGIDKKYKDVATAQAYLKLMNFYIGDEGIDGKAPNPSNSWQAIKTFQDMVGGLDADGIVNQTTLDKMKQAVISNWTIEKIILDLNDKLIQTNKKGYIRPTYGYRVTDDFFTKRGSVQHMGIDLSGSRIGSGRPETPSSMYRMPVYAVDDGYIGFARNMPSLGGNYIILVSDSGYNFRYLHLDGFGPVILNNSDYDKSTGFNFFDPDVIRVKKGEFLGYVGNTGNSTGDHLHFDMYDSQLGLDFNKYSGKYLNPEDFITLR